MNYRQSLPQPIPTSSTRFSKQSISPLLPPTLPFRHDRHLNLISALSQSSSPLFTKLSEPLLDPTFHLHPPLPRSFTDPASSFIRMASTNPPFFRCLFEMFSGFIIDIALWTALCTVEVVSDSPSEPHCLDFGIMTDNFVVLLKAMTEARMDIAQYIAQFNLLPHFLLTLLVLSAASTNDELSTAAVSVFSNQFGLSTPHTEALLFATPTTFPISDAFTPRHTQKSRESDGKRGSCRSICAEAGRCVALMSLSDISFTDHKIDRARMLVIPFAGCLVNALHSTTTLPHSFPFLSPELCGLSSQSSVWNDSSQLSALPVLTALADMEIIPASCFFQWGQKLTHEEEERRDITFLHLFPFLGTDSQTFFLSSFNMECWSEKQKVHLSLPRVVECLVEMATVNAYNTPITLLREMRTLTKFLSHVDPETHTVQHHSIFESSFEQSIVERLKSAEGEERWRLVTQLAVASHNCPDLTDELMNVENDVQALFVLSIHTFRSSSHLFFSFKSNPDALDRVIEFAGRLNNLQLVAEALFHIGDTVSTCLNPHLEYTVFDVDRRLVLRDLVFNTLRVMVARCEEGVEERCDLGKDEAMVQIVDSCLKVLRFLMVKESFDSSPFVDILISLTVTTDLSLLRSILLVLQQIEERTRNTPTPFSVCTATSPCRKRPQSSTAQQPLTFHVASVLLSAILDPTYLSQRALSIPSSRGSPFISQTTSYISLSQLLQGLNEYFIDGVAKQSSNLVCFLVEMTKRCSSQILTSDDQFEIGFDHLNRHATSQQLFLTLLEMIFPVDVSHVSASALLPLAPFLTRILTIVVPSSPDRTELCFEQDEHSQLLNSFLSLVLSLINTATPSTLSTPPLSSLLSVLSIALVRLDTFPSSLKHHSRFYDLFRLSENRSNPQMRQFVLALSSDGMEDRSDLALDSFSMTFLKVWKGANV
ncbi:hypothetical protein BLNAU_24063 [Blattamonas nauphoetae]|uniref:Uncharacterized protein n=1 Tax=Blattamonas nauphoetae TaxID=2049346 RepID=A0ABQ9WPH0_9EUKA|nr:hypothetical protein BLNAU_24063 [Blattamonas nauphoetae]